MWSAALFLSFFLNPVFIHDDLQADHWIREAMHANYDLRLDDSQHYIDLLQSKYPDHPSGYLLEAERYWWQAQAEPANKQVEKNYYQAQKLAVQKAESALTQEKYARTELLSYLAGAYGSLARFQVTRKSAYFSALRAGTKAVKYANEVHQLDPNYYEIYTALGAYNCFTGDLPSVIRPFAFLIGVHGNKQLGLEQLRIAMEKSRYSRTEANIVHYAVLLAGKQYPEAFQILETFRTEFPNNFVFYDWIANWFVEQHKYSDGAKYFQALASAERMTEPLMAKHAQLKAEALERDATNGKS